MCMWETLQLFEKIQYVPLTEIMGLGSELMYGKDDDDYNKQETTSAFLLIKSMSINPRLAQVHQCRKL